MKNDKQYRSAKMVIRISETPSSLLSNAGSKYLKNVNQEQLFVKEIISFT